MVMEFVQEWVVVGLQEGCQLGVLKQTGAWSLNLLGRAGVCVAAGEEAVEGGGGLAEVAGRIIVNVVNVLF